MTPNFVKKATYGLLAGSLIIQSFLFWQERNLIAKGYPDFTIFYSAGLMVRQGLGHQLYDYALQFQSQRSFAPDVEIRRTALPYNHPPFEALIFSPLTFLRYQVAFVIWNFLNLGMLGAVTMLLRSQIPILLKRSPAVWLLGLLGFFPVFACLLQGQDAILLLLLEALAFTALKRNSDFLCGWWLGVGSFRIQLVLPLVLVFLGWKRRKILLGFLAACLIVGIVSVGIVGWNEAVHYPASVMRMERVVEQSSMVPSMPNLRGLVEGWPVSSRFPTLSLALVFALSFVLLFFVIAARGRGFHRHSELYFALASVTALLISYHAFSHDLVLLVIPLVVVVNLISEAEFRSSFDPALVLPVVLLLTTPFYFVLWLYLFHLNLIALVLLLWLPAIRMHILERVT